MSELLIDAGQAQSLFHGPAAPSQHSVQFYEDETFLARVVTRYLAEGLALGEAVVVIATADHRRLFREGLEATGFDVDRALASGQLTMLDVRESLSRFMKGDEPGWQEFEASVGAVVARGIATSKARRVRAFGEMVDQLWRQGLQQAALRLEAFWERLGARHPISLLCAYVMGNFYKEADTALFQEVCGAHQHVLAPAGFSPVLDDDARRREVAFLQQRARALETELKERALLEAQLRAAREEAETATRAKDEFLAVLGHELRNPLSPILTALELMKLRGDGRSSHEQEVILRQTRHLMRLVDDLLDISRVTCGKVELRREVIDLRDVLAKATEIASPLLEQRQQQLEVDAPGRGLLLLADEARLAQVIANLLTNAAKYTPPQGHISLLARRDGGDAVIEVRDDGIGIDGDLLPRVFDLFVQGRQSMDRSQGGLGIGLALVRSLVNLHGGSAAAHSAGLGKGSTFTVRLPALEASGGAREPCRRAAPWRPRQRRRVLVVDDNDDALQMLAETLRLAGHDVRTAVDGASALELARQFRPEVALLDIGLPAMDGYELAQRLRQELRDAPPRLLALTGYGRESDASRSREAGFALHLVKPLEAADVLASIEG